MLTVTNPKTNKVYTFANRNRMRAWALADKMGTVVNESTGNPFGCCRRPSCGGCDDAYDAMRDGMAERGTLRASRYYR